MHQYIQVFFYDSLTYQEKKKILVIQCPDTIHNPYTMMVHFQYTPPAWNNEQMKLPLVEMKQQLGF